MNKNWFHQRGQALIELATFGSILLFCLSMLVQYCLQGNYQQTVGMRGFRKAIQQAYNNSGPSAGASVHLIEDKRMITADNAYGLAERSQFESEASVTWDNDVMDDYTSPPSDAIPNVPRPAYLPKKYIQINNDVNNHYTTAGYVYDVPCSGSITVRVPETLGIPEAGGTKYWQDYAILCANTKIVEEELKKGYKFLVGTYTDDHGNEQQIGSADVDQDGNFETILLVNGTKGEDITSFLVLDDEAGTLDTNKATAATDSDTRQGLMPGYTKLIWQGADIKKRESVAQITTTVDAHSNEAIFRRIRLQDGEHNITSFANYNANNTWNATK